jgi:hypothetical protein
MSMRSESPQTLASRSPTAQRRHVGLDPSFVDKDQAVRVEVGLEGPPALSPAGNIGTGLLKGEQRFF